MDESALTARVMRRVYALYVLKHLTSIEGRLVFLALAALALAVSVSVPNVIQNMPPLFEVPRVAQFFWSALMHTTFPVQALISAFTLLGGWILYDAFRAMPARYSLQ